MIASPIMKIAQELLAGAEPIQAGRRLVAHAEAVGALQRDYEGLKQASQAIVERMQGSVDDLVKLRNEVEKRAVKPVDSIP
jgi:hypothetical protein